VKSMRRGPDGIILNFVAREKGKPGVKLVVSQADWDTHGEWRSVASPSMDYIRSLVPVG
jgi:hypothetical protein